MQRRTFIQTMGAAAMLPAEGKETAPHYYLLQQYYLKNGTQGARIAEYLKNGLLEAATRLGVPGPRFVLEALIAPHMPQVACVSAYSTLDAMNTARGRLAADNKLQAALNQWEAGEEAPYESYSEVLLEAAPYAPPLPAASGGKPRVFELRLYHSPTQKQLKALHERFAGPEIRIFHRSGIHPVLYSSTLIGPSKPNLIYLIPFDDLAAREKSWAAFGADPEWIKVRAESVAKSGQISSVMQMSLFKGADYSPIR